MGECHNTTAYVWRWEDRFEGLALSFQACPGEQTQVSRFVSAELAPIALYHTQWKRGSLPAGDGVVTAIAQN